MDTTTWSDEDRFLLLATLRQFRANYNESPEDDYSNRDELERKLEHGGELAGSDQFVLKSAIDNELEVNDQWRHLVEIIDYHLQ